MHECARAAEALVLLLTRTKTLILVPSFCPFFLSSYPVALFVFEVENTSSSSAVDVSLMQSWHNGTGHIQRDQAGGHYNRAFEEQVI